MDLRAPWPGVPVPALRHHNRSVAGGASRAQHTARLIRCEAERPLEAQLGEIAWFSLEHIECSYGLGIGALCNYEHVEGTPIELGGTAAGEITDGRQSDAYWFEVATLGRYRIRTTGDALLHVDIRDARGRTVYDDDRGDDSISVRYGVNMLRLLDPGRYQLRVSSSQFAPNSTGAYAIFVEELTGE